MNAPRGDCPACQGSGLRWGTFPCAWLHPSAHHASGPTPKLADCECAAAGEPDLSQTADHGEEG